MLMSDVGNGANAAGITLSFDDTATNSLAQYGSISSGRFKPTDYEPGETLPESAPSRPYSTSLSVLTGTNPNGKWSLYVVDDAGGDNGRIEGWSLQLTTAGVINPPAPFWEFSPGSTNGPASFILHGRIGDTWQFDASPDLVNWTTILTNTMTTNLFLLTDPAASNFNSRFYRAVWRP